METIKMMIEATPEQAKRVLEVLTAAPAPIAQPTAAPVAQPVQQPTVTPAPQPAPVAIQPPVAAPPVAQATTYTVNDLMLAARPLLANGQQAALQGLLAKYNVVGVFQLQEAQLQDFAADLRAIGGQL